MPRRLEVPDLEHGAVRLEPLARALAPEFAWVLAADEETTRFTYIPSRPDAAFLERWLGRYEDAWKDETLAGFAVRADEELVGFAAFVQLNLDGRQGELGYVVAPSARGRGVATTAVRLLTSWGFDALGLQRIELRIDPRNVGSERVAERVGYRREGILRSVAFKEGLRSDVGIWARLADD